VGDEIIIKGATTNFAQKVDSIQIEHNKVEEAKAGDSIGLLVNYRVRAGDEVFK
jgi:putative protease